MEHDVHKDEYHQHNTQNDEIKMALSGSESSHVK